jgi:hypothetical protein
MKRLLLVLATACASAPQAPSAAAISSYSGNGCVEMAVLRPVTVRSGGVESTASGAFLRFEPAVQIRR